MSIRRLGLLAAAHLALLAPAGPALAAPSFTLQTTTPADGANVAGTIGWAVSYSGSQPARVSFYVDGVLEATDGSAPFAINLDTTALSNASHTLRATGVKGSFSASTQLSVTVQNAPAADTQPPTAPANLVASAIATSSVSLAWSASSDNVAVAGYDVYLNGVKQQQLTATSATVSGLSCATGYSFAVDAYDAAGNHSPASTITATTSACTNGVVCAKYASPTGSDSGTGSSSSPFLTAQKLANSLAPGEVGCLNTGSYGGNVTIGTSGITLTTTPGSARATLAVDYLWIKAGATGVTVSNVLIDGTAWPAITVQLFGDGAVLRNDEITNGHRTGSCVVVGDYEGTWATVVSNVVIDHDVIHGCGMLSDGAHDHGIYLASSRYAQVTNNVLYDNEGGWGIQLWADAHYSTISNNVLDGNYAGNIIVAGGNYSSLGPSSNNSFTKNIITWPHSGYNVASYWEGSVGTNNVFTDNCVYGGVDGNFDYADGGFVESGTIYADPLYLNRAAHDYRLQAGSPCAGLGPS